MTDIAELGFAVNTAGLKEGSSELDRFKGKAKEVEDQVKKIDTATAKAGDGAKKLGTDTKAASAALDGMAKSSGAAEAAAKRLGITVEEYNARTRATKAAIAEATAATQAATPAMTTAATATRSLATAKQAATTAARAAAPAITATATAAQAVAPAMATAATAARAMASAKSAAVITSANLASSLNVLRPAVVAAGGAMTAFMPIAAAARFGLAGVGLAAAGGAALGIAKAGDEADRSRSRFSTLLGSTEAGTRSFNQLRGVARQTGTSFDTLSGAVERAVGGLNKVADQPGVYRVFTQGSTAVQQFAANVSEAFGTVDRILATGRASSQETATALNALGESFNKTGTLSADAFRKIAEASPKLALEIAKAFNVNSIDQFERRLERAPLPAQVFIRAMEQIGPRVKQEFDSAGDSVDRATGKMGAAWDNLLGKLTQGGVGKAITGGLNDAASGVDRLSTAIENDIRFFTDWENIIPRVGAILKNEADQLPALAQGFLDLADKIGTAGASIITFFEGQVSGAIQSAANALAPAVAGIISMLDGIIAKAFETGRAIANALTSSPAPGGGSIPTISDTGDVTAPQALGNAFSGGRVIPYALGGVITKPTLFPMADGMGLMGEAGPEAVMPLARTSDGKLGVNVADTTRASVPVDPFVDIELAIEDQTAELRNALDSQADAIGGDINKSASDIIAAIEAGNILLNDFANRSNSAASTQVQATNQFGGAVDGFGNAVAGFGSAVQVASGGGQFTSSQQWAPAGAAPNPVMMSTRVINASPSSGGGGGGSSIAAALGFYDAWGGGRARGGGDAIFAGPFATGGSFTVPGSGGTDSVRTIMDVTPGERVTVSTPGQVGADAGLSVEGGINISLHGITRPKDWLDNESVIKARIAQAVTEAMEAR